MINGSTILFVSHDATPTGAPFLLLHLLHWLKKNTKLQFKVVLKKAGLLEAQFAELAHVVVAERRSTSLPARVLRRLGPQRLKEKLDDALLRRMLGGTKFALVYSNTLVNGAVLRRLPDQQCPLLTHAHELEYIIQRYTTPAELDYTLRRTTQFIAGSAAVARNLVDNHGVAGTSVEVVHEFIPLQGLTSMPQAESARQLRTSLGIPEGAFVVGAAGTVDWRKGYDLFIHLAIEMLRATPQRDVYFVWIGGATRNIAAEVAFDLRKLGLEQRVRFVGHQNNYLHYLAMFDVLCLASREDPFPLVVLESAALGKPVVCFADSGGASEFIEDDCGSIVPYFDIQAMAACLTQLIDNPTLKKELGLRGQAKVRERHDVEFVGPRILEIIERSIASRRNDPAPASRLNRH